MRLDEQSMLSRVGWGEAAPVSALIMSIHYAKAVDATPWVLALMMLGLLLIHWFMHYVLGCGGGTWRSLLRSSCSLTLSASIAVRVVNNGNYSMVTILLSCIFCTFDSFVYSRYGNIAKGILNWGSILCLFLALTSGDPEFFYNWKKDDSYDERNWAYLLFSMDLLACPIQDMSLKKGLIWQIVCSVCLPIIISQGQGKQSGGGFRVIQGYALAFVLPSILLAQRSLFWHWIIPPITSSSSTNIRNVRLWYTVACCGSLSICCISYRPLEQILLAIHFGLHWLAHVCRGLALLLKSKNSLAGKQPD
jgi:hypothetical protein